MHHCLYVSGLQTKYSSFVSIGHLTTTYKMGFEFIFFNFEYWT